MNYEILEHFDEKNQLLGEVTREEAYLKGLRQRAAHVLIVNSQGRFLVQQRSANKASWSNAYDLSSAETASPGEKNDETARRGIREELMITENTSLVMIRDWYFRNYTPPEPQYTVCGFVRLFLGRYDGEVQMDPNEVQWYGWLAPEEIDVLLVDTRLQCTPWFKDDWRFLRENFDAYMREIHTVSF